VKAIVTGGAGFIGSNLVDALRARGDEVAVVDDFSTGRRENLRQADELGVRVHEADIRDPDAMTRILGEEAPEAVFHLAAQIDVRRSVADPRFDADVNVGGTISLLEAARLAGVRRFVYTSTGGAIYGETDRIPSPESTPVAPLAGYGQSKYAGEGYCSLYSRLHGLSTISLRYSNVYGPRQDPLGEAGVVAIFCGRVLEGGRPTVYGDGTQTRDFVYVDDVVAANLAAVESGYQGPVNIGTGEETSVLELAAAFRPFAADGSFEPELAPPRHGELHRSCLDVSRAREVLGWGARTSLREGLERTMRSAQPAAGA
jgi:UDP-glucose 4-epimerase